MTDDEWMTLFELISKVVDLEGFTASEKAAMLRGKAKEFGAEAELEEFTEYIEETG
jgi:hypothetical protein